MATKKFSWSFSKLTSFETCPKRHYEVSIAKNFKDTTEQLDWGNVVHGGAAKALTAGVQTLPLELAFLRPWLEKTKRFPGEQILVEQKYAINKQFGPTAYYAPDVWFRCVGDLVKIGRRASILDWKTGKPKPDSVQLMLSAQCVFAHYPQVEEVVTGYAWLKEDADDDDAWTIEGYTRDMLVQEWPAILNRVANLEEAERTLTFPPKPGGLCRSYCPVNSCPFHGKGRS